MIFIGIGTLGLDLGAILLFISLIAYIIDAILVISGERVEKWEIYSEISLIAGSTAYLISFLYFSYSTLIGDYSFVYVNTFVNNDMDLFLRLSAVWSGQAGSYFFWTTIAIITYLVFRTLFRAYAHETIIWRSFVLTAIQITFFIALTLISNPFKLESGPIVDGIGLNPALMNFWNIIHPPIILAGYVLCLVPMVIGIIRISALKDGKIPDFEAKEKLDRFFEFMISLAWLVLSAGIIIGAYWAYVTLGWGGFWAWDPVETASLTPWLFLTLYFHGRSIYHRKNEFLGNYIVSMSYVGALFATYITRSGIISSVHAFSPEGELEKFLTIFIPQNSFIMAIILRFIPDERILLLFILLTASFILPLYWGFKYKKIRLNKMPIKLSDFTAEKSTRTALKVSYLSFFIGIYVMIIGLITPVIFDILGYLITLSPEGFENAITIDAIFYNTILTLFGGIMLLAQFFCTFFPRMQFRRKIQLLVTGSVLAMLFSLSGILYRNGVFFSLLGLNNPIISFFSNFWTSSDKANLVLPLILIGIIGLLIEFGNVILKEEKYLLRKTSQTMLHLSILIIILGAITSSNMTNSQNIQVELGGEYVVPDTTLTIEIIDLDKRFPEKGSNMIEYDTVFVLKSSGRVVGYGLSRLSVDKSNRLDQEVTIIGDLLNNIYIVTIATYEEIISERFIAADLQIKIIPYINILWIGCLLLIFAIIPLTINKFLLLRAIFKQDEIDTEIQESSQSSIIIDNNGKIND